jgi:hypothetical protein
MRRREGQGGRKTGKTINAGKAKAAGVAFLSFRLSQQEAEPSRTVIEPVDFAGKGRYTGIERKRLRNDAKSACPLA